MASDGFDFSELTQYERRLLDLANKKMPRETKKFLGKEGIKLRKKTLAKAKSKVKKKTGRYFKSIKKGRVYLYSPNQALSIRVYSSAPHAHLIENGHRIVDENGTEHGFQTGKHVFGEAQRQFQNEFFGDCQDFIDEMLDKGL